MKPGGCEGCPSDSKFVSLFVKGLHRKYKKFPKKAHPISFETLDDSDLESLSFVKLHFITMLLTLYSSFVRYEEISKLTLSDVVREELGFVLNFQKAKSYQFGESHIGVVSNLPNLAFNPARVFSIYLDKIAS